MRKEQCKKDLMKKIREHSALIGIIGLGYVGQPLLLRFVEEGFAVLGFDIDDNVVTTLNDGISHIKHISSEKISMARRANKFKATTDFRLIADVDAIIICVPTPLDMHRQPDLSYIINTMKNILPYLRNGQILSLESTTWPGTTEEVLRPMLEGAGFYIGEDFFLVYSPEREDPGNPDFTTADIPKVIGGSTQACLDVGKALYEKIVVRVVPVSSTRAAEMTKLLENIHRAVNIGLVNEMKIVADKMGLNIHEIIDAAATKPFGFVPFYPGPGLGGHCIPIDPFYLTWKAREYGVHTRFIELAGEINASMPDFVVQKVLLALNARGKPLNGAKVLLLGVAYKKNIDDMRESPAVEIMDKLQKLGANVEYHDPYVPVFPKMRRYRFNLKSVTLTEKKLGEVDCVLVTTDHDNIDYDFILENASLIVDARGRFPVGIENVIAA